MIVGSMRVGERVWSVIVGTEKVRVGRERVGNVRVGNVRVGSKRVRSGSGE